jgi:RecA-family ATPase
MSPILGFLRRLSFETGCAVIVAHHTPKPSESNRGWRAGQRLRGSGDFYAVMHSGMFLTRPKGPTWWAWRSSTVPAPTHHRSPSSFPGISRT